MHGLETINAMNLGTAIKAAAPVTAASVFTVVWQGVDFITTNEGEEEVAKNYVTEVTPDQYGYLEVPVFTEIWGAIACGEQFDGDNPFDRIDVVAVLEGGYVQVETEDRADD